MEIALAVLVVVAVAAFIWKARRQTADPDEWQESLYMNEEDAEDDEIPDVADDDGSDPDE